mgnify:CR=1 FL=1
MLFDKKAATSRSGVMDAFSTNTGGAGSSFNITSRVHERHMNNSSRDNGNNNIFFITIRIYKYKTQKAGTETGWIVPDIYFSFLSHRPYNNGVGTECVHNAGTGSGGFFVKKLVFAG